MEETVSEEQFQSPDLSITPSPDPSITPSPEPSLSESPMPTPTASPTPFLTFPQTQTPPTQNPIFPSMPTSASPPLQYEDPLPSVSPSSTPTQSFNILFMNPFRSNTFSPVLSLVAIVSFTVAGTISVVYIVFYIMPFIREDLSPLL